MEEDIMQLLTRYGVFIEEGKRDEQYVLKLLMKNRTLREQLKQGASDAWISLVKENEKVYIFIDYESVIDTIYLEDKVIPVHINEGKHYPYIRCDHIDEMSRLGVVKHIPCCRLVRQKIRQVDMPEIKENKGEKDEGR